MSFAFPAGGAYSYQAIEALAARFCPVKLSVTSDLRPGASDWHGHGWAVDFAAPYDHAAGSNQMRDAAAWWDSVCGDHLLELIHSMPDSAGGGTHLIKNGAHVSPEFYTWPVVNQHENHVHVAMTLAAANDLSARLSSAPSNPAPAPAASSAGGGRAWGWDASNHDWGRGPMDLAAARRAGVSFFVHKATGAGDAEGGRYSDPYFAQAMSRARSAGIPALGAYHVLAPAAQATIESQVDQFLSAVNAAAPWWREAPWIWQADCEDWGTGVWPTAGDAKAFLDLLKARTGHGLTVAYLPRHHYVDAPDIGHEVWNADYHTSGSSLSELYPGDGDRGWAPYASGRSPLILQYASDAHIGSQPRCDANAVKMSEQQLVERCGGVEVAFMDDVNAAALAWRVDALVHGLDVVAGGPTKGEKVTLKVPAAPVAISDTQTQTIAATVADSLRPQVEALRAEVVSLRARLAAAERAQADALAA